MKTWQEHLAKYKNTSATFELGFRHGWLDASIGYSSLIAQTSKWGEGVYAFGYKEGQRSYLTRAEK